MNLPTKLTIARIMLIPIFIALFFIPFPFHRVVATGVFIVASLTDFLDGYLARKNNMVTDLGKFLDPIADKMLVACALFAVCIFPSKADGAVVNGAVYIQVAIVVCSMIIICRELMVSGFRIVASSKNLVLAADKLGKIKTFLQMVALIILLPIADIVEKSTSVGNAILYVGLAILVLSTIMAIVSAINYLVKNKQVLKN